MQGADHAAELRARGAVGRHEDEDVADGAREDAAPRHRFADADAGTLPQRERLARAPVADEFDAGDEAGLADVTDVGQGPERLQFMLQIGGEAGARALVDRADTEDPDLHISIVGGRVILVVIFDQRSSLGLVRLRVKKASEELAGIFAAVGSLSPTSWTCTARRTATDWTDAGTTVSG